MKAINVSHGSNLSELKKKGGGGASEFEKSFSFGVCCQINSSFIGQGPLLSPSVRGLQMVCVCVYRMNFKYTLHWHIHISVHSMLCYTHILLPFEDGEPTGLKVDIAFHCKWFSV